MPLLNKAVPGHPLHTDIALNETSTPPIAATTSSNDVGSRACCAPWGQELFNAHPQPLMLLDAQGHVRLVNMAARRQLGSPGSIPLASLFEQDLPPSLVEALRLRRLWEGSMRVKTRDGGPQQVKVKLQPSSQDAQASAWLIQIEEPSLTDHRRTSLRADEVQFRQAVDGAPVMVWMAGHDHDGEWFNRPWREFTGRDLADLQGSGWQSDVHPEDLERCVGIYVASFNERQPFSLDYRLRRHDGQYRWLLVNGAPRWAADGRLQGYIGIGVDIHERKELEERLAGHSQARRLAERRQNEFLAMLSHELRGPLAPIANAASVLRSLEGDNDTLCRLRQIIDRQVGRMRSIVDDMVDVTRVMQGQIALVKQPVSVDDLLHSAIETSQPRLDAGQHRLQIDKQVAAATLMVLGDAVRLSQALSHLLSNAAKFTQTPSDICLTVSANSESVSIAVRDKGPGISAEFLPYVFDLFTQQDNPRVRALGGLGLGLPLARRVAQLHGGDVKATSAGWGHGAEFKLSLPLMTTHVSAPSGMGGAAVPAPSSPPYRVLLIEDNPDTRYLLRLQIELWGHEVSTAGQVEEALQLADAFRPDIVLCDLSLPGLNSAQMMRDISKQPGHSRPLFAALATHDHYEDEAMAHASGYDAFLVKPLRPESLGQLFKANAERLP